KRGREATGRRAVAAARHGQARAVQVCAAGHDRAARSHGAATKTVTSHGAVKVAVGRIATAHARLAATKHPAKAASGTRSHTGPSRGTHAATKVRVSGQRPSVVARR